MSPALPMLLIALASTLAHPVPAIYWGEYPSVVAALRDASIWQALQWQAMVHSPGMTRPARALIWWLGAGWPPWGVGVVNAMAVSAMAGAVTQIAWVVTLGRWWAAIGAGLAVLASYASVYPLLPFLGFGVSAALALVGVAWFFSGGRGWVCALWLLMGGLGHETLLALALVPMAWVVWVDGRRETWGRAWPSALVPAIYLTVSVSTTAHPVWWPGAVPWTTPARVLTTLATAGAPLEILRAMPWLPEFAQVREVVVMPWGMVTTLAMVIPPLILTWLAWRRGSRRCGFLATWLGLASAPLLVSGAPEAFHLTGALVALWVLWAMIPWRHWRWVVVLMALWAAPHLWARWVLYTHDLPVIARTVQWVEEAIEDAKARGIVVKLAGVPVLVGAHYGQLPTIPGAAGRVCIQGEPRWLGRGKAWTVPRAEGQGWIAGPPARARHEQWQHLDRCW